MSINIETRNEALKNFRKMFNYAVEHTEQIVDAYGDRESFHSAFDIDAFYGTIVDCMVSDGIFTREYADELHEYRNHPLCRYDCQMSDMSGYTGMQCIYCPINFGESEELFPCTKYTSLIEKQVKLYGNETDPESRKIILVKISSVLKTIARLPQNKTV